VWFLTDIVRQTFIMYWQQLKIDKVIFYGISLRLFLYLRVMLCYNLIIDAGIIKFLLSLPF